MGNSLVIMKACLVLPSSGCYNPRFTRSPLSLCLSPHNGHLPCTQVFSLHGSHGSHAGLAAAWGPAATRPQVRAPSAGLGTVPAEAKAQQAKLARWGQPPNQAKPGPGVEFLDTSPISGPYKDQAGLFPQQDELHPGWSFVFVPASTKLSTIPHPPMHGPQNAHLAVPQRPHFHQQHPHFPPSDPVTLHCSRPRARPGCSHTPCSFVWTVLP